MDIANSSEPRVAVMTFAYEADREIAFDLLESLVLSFGSTKFDLFVTDDASPSRVGEQIEQWAKERGIFVECVRYEKNQGFRGAVERTLRLIRQIALRPKTYDFVLRIDTDALVIRDGIGRALQAACRDPRGLYGIVQRMRPKDRVGFLLDLLPFGLKRELVQGRIGKKYGLTRVQPVWWCKIGALALARGFRFEYVEGSCYAFGGEVPKVLLDRGYLDKYDERRHGLITSEEDVVVTMLCHAAGLPLYALDHHDKTWKDVNTVGIRVLDRSLDESPYVIHALKPNAEDQKVRDTLKNNLPLFRRSSRESS